MGSVATDSSEEEQPFTVLITGFGPFKRDYPVNPSWEIARSLPTHLPPLRAKAPQQQQQQPLPSNPHDLPPVRLLVHPAPIRVNYKTVRALVPQLWGLERIDAAIHVGMAGPRLFYSIERRGHREGYNMPDVDGELLGDDSDEKHMDLRVSEDAGHYLCDFIYFSSLAHLEKAGERRRVLFLHVPSDASEHSVATGRELLLQLVRSVVESEIAAREKEKAEAAS
ncbi:hypothetical protein B0I37DRAFT_445699 [Chaetomium sp. MPI-CAGE-AT-0009]|nr:hypothetical protein B0I37DRAFT_445699 [Chaetomium sp. MPI-CAGE-AT-0009]